MQIKFPAGTMERAPIALPLAIAIVLIVYFWQDIPPLLHTFYTFIRTRYACNTSPHATHADITPIPHSQ